MSERPTAPTSEGSELELWRTTADAEGMRFVASLHESVASALTESLAHAVKLRFSGFAVGGPLKFLERFPENTYVVLFCGEALPHAGAVLFSPELGHQIIAKWFNLQKTSEKKAFTALEESSFWRVAERLTQVFLSVYAKAGLNQPTVVSRGRLRDMTDALVSLREIVAFKYALETPAAERMGLPICAVLDTEMASRLVGPEKDDSPPEDISVAAHAARHLPIETSVVLGSFRISLAELAAIKANDTILLPDPNEAWLGAGNSIKLLPLEVELAGEQAKFYVLGGDEVIDDEGEA